MNILFIYPNRSHQEAISIGLAYISGYLKMYNRNHDIRLFDFTWGASTQDLYNLIKEFNPKIIGITSSTLDFNFCKEIIRNIKKISEALIVMGGPHPTVAPEDSIQFADVICIGEGEKAFKKLVEKIENHEDFSKIENLWVRKGNNIIKNELCNLIEDLDNLECDRELFDIQKYNKARNYTVEVFAGRGCPYNCTYCINHFQQKLYKGKGKYIRSRLPENVIDEIKILKSKYPILKISFPDDTFTANKKWLIKFCEMYRKEINIPFVCNARVENLDDDICKSLKAANCYALKMGVESGSEEIRKNVLNRLMSNNQIINAFKLCKKHGIKTFSYNMVGIPNETKNDMVKTIELNRIIKPDESAATVWHPFPGTELYYFVKEKGWITNKKVDDYYSQSVMSYENISAKEIKRIRDNFAFNVYIKYNLIKAIRALLEGRLFTKYGDIRAKLPIIIRKIIQKIANIS
ncbi:MAG: B12-binding domain-containing radical SAM protein [Candidatus Hodarchaeota archaeon]